MLRRRHEKVCPMFRVADRVSPKPIKITEGLKCSKCGSTSKNGPAFSRHKLKPVVYAARCATIHLRIPQN